MNKMSIDLKVGETLTIGGATVLLVKKSGHLARLVVTAEANTQIKTPSRNGAQPANAQESTHAHGLDS